MMTLRSDSPLCRRIVGAFLDFLGSVQPAPGVDLEGLDVVRECLEETFKLNTDSTDSEVRPGVLIDLFSHLETSEQSKVASTVGSSRTESTSCVTSEAQKFDKSIDFKTRDQIGASHVLGGDAKDELFGNFFAALDGIDFFKTSPEGVEDPALIAKATKFFNDALTEMENSQEQMISLNNLAEMFKLRGNRLMQSKSYIEAIDLYTCAIALCEKNAVYYCNRAAAFTHMQRYTEAIHDCMKSIELDPNYSKAYSRLGHAYFGQGNYRDALTEGFLKVAGRCSLPPVPHQLPNISEKLRGLTYKRQRLFWVFIEVTQQKLMEHRPAESGQNTGSNLGQDSSPQPGESTNRTTHGSFSFSFPPEFPNIFRTVPQSAESSGNNNNPSSSTFSGSIPPEFTNMFRTASQAAGSTNNGTQFSSFPFNASTATEFTEVFRTMASSGQGNQAHERAATGNSEGVDEPDIRTGANVSFNFDETPEQVSDVLRSVMGMFSQQGSQRNRPGGNDPA